MLLNNMEVTEMEKEEIRKVVREGYGKIASKAARVVGLRNRVVGALIQRRILAER